MTLGFGFVVVLLCLLAFLDFSLDGLGANGAGESHNRDIIVKREYVTKFLDGVGGGVDEGLRKVGARCRGENCGVRLDLDLGQVFEVVVNEDIAAAEGGNVGVVPIGVDSAEYHDVGKWYRRGTWMK